MVFILLLYTPDLPRPYDLSGKPKSTPNGGYTNRCNLRSRVNWSEYSFSSLTSSASRSIRTMFSLMRSGVTDLAKTVLPRDSKQQQGTLRALAAHSTTSRAF